MNLVNRDAILLNIDRNKVFVVGMLHQEYEVIGWEGEYVICLCCGERLRVHENDVRQIRVVLKK